MPPLQTSARSFGPLRLRVLAARRDPKTIRGSFADEEVIEKLPVDLREEASRRRTATAASRAGRHAPVRRHPARRHRSDDQDLRPRRDFPRSVKPFAADAWTTRRARDIFCYIATSKHRRVDKDVLIDAFWADEDLDAIEKNFHPTISHIRKALNSAASRSSRISLSFATAPISSTPSFHISIDTEEFERADRRGRKGQTRKGLRGLSQSASRIRQRALPRRIHGGRLRGLGRGAAQLLRRTAFARP